MRIAQVAPLYESVPPKKYGGTERVVSWLTEELVRRGHDVTLFASGDSSTGARLVATHARGLRLDDDGAADPFAAHIAQLGAVADRLDYFYVVHCHVYYLAFLGRLSGEKGPEMAVAVAHEVGIPLRIAAKTDPHDREYFEREMRPLIDGTFIQYVGEIRDDEKWKFLGEALCLLFPIDWPEPFGLAMIEALACGTPVVARPCGAVPEIVRDGEVGFLADTVDELVAAVKRVDVIDRARCRRWAEAQFSVG